MKMRFRRVIAFIMAVLMVLSMPNWSGLSTVAKADTTTTIYLLKDKALTEWVDQYLHAYNSSGYTNAAWPGAQMTYLQEYGDYYLYSATINAPSAGYNLIFNGGNGKQQSYDYGVSSDNASKPYHLYTIKASTTQASDGTYKYEYVSSGCMQKSTFAELGLTLSGGSGDGGGTTTGSGFVGSTSANTVYVYADDATEDMTMTLRYRTTSDGGDNIDVTAEAIAGCPGWYRVEIANPIGYIQLNYNGGGNNKEWRPGITSSSGTTLVLTFEKADNYATYSYQNSNAATAGASAVEALGLTAGYPGKPYPDTMDVWYYNPAWATAEDVVLNYESSLVKTSTVATSYGSGMPGWFYFDGSTNGIYVNNSDNTIKKISFAAAAGAVNTKEWSSSDAVVAAATSVLYLSETGTAYATLEELVAAESPSVSPLSDTTITLYSTQDLTGATVTAEVNGETVTGTVAAGTEANQYVIDLDFNAAVNNATVAITKGSINVSVKATGIEMYVNANTGVNYDSWTALQNGLTSTLTFKNAAAALTNVKATVVQMDYSTGTTTTKDVTLTLTAGENGTYTATVPTDAEKLGYTLSYLYDAKPYISRISEENAVVDLNNISENLIAYFYTGIDGDGVSSEFKTGWTSVYADIFYYPAGSSEKTYINGWKECTYVGNGWWSVDTGASATDSDYENGIFIKFKNGNNSGESTKAFQFLNNYRVFATSQMNMFKSAEKALQVLRETEQDLPEENTGATTVWFYHPGGWDNYNLHGYDSNGNAITTAPMTRDEALTNNAGGYWYHAAVPTGTKTIYFSDSTDANKTVVYDISSNTASEIFCAASTDVISSGWSTSPAEIAKYYDLVNNPSTNEISLPITILDYNKDDLFFQYDSTIMRAMTFVLANHEYLIGGKNVAVNLGYHYGDAYYIDYAYVIDGNGDENNRPGNVPYFDRNGIEYVTGILETELVNGNPVYTQKAITYVAKIVQIYCNIADIEQGKTAVFQNLQSQNYNKTYTDAEWATLYNNAKTKFDGMSAAEFASYDVTTAKLNVMEYVYYVMNNFYNTNSKFNKDYDMYSYLVLKKTSPNVYGFYANYSSDKTADYLDQNYGVAYVPAADGSGKIYNSDSGQNLGGFFPYDWQFINSALGSTVANSVQYTEGTINEQTASHNYHYTMRASGKFLYEEDKDLYFTFTGDDDVVLYINGKIALDLSGAHRSASYTVYLSDLNDNGFNLVDGVYYDFDFFYMERHTEYSNLRIETNIDPIDTAGKVQKYAYEDKDGDGVAETRIPSGAYREEGTEVSYEFELTAPSADGLKNLIFTDPSLGVTISSEKIELGSYTTTDGTVVDRKISDLTVMVGTTTYSGSTLTEDKLKEILATGIQAGERITISGFEYVLNNGITGTVTAEGDGIEASTQHIITTDTHTININKPSITVTKSAVDSEGNNLPEGSVLQAGETATYTINLSNSGNAPLINLTIDDEELGFYMDKNGVKLNAYTEPKDVVFTILGTGAIDGIYQITPSTNEDPVEAAKEDQAALDALAAKIATVVYNSDASLSVSGINYPIVSTFPSTAVGTAHYLTNISDDVMKGIESYGKAYKAYVEAGKTGTEPQLGTYVNLDEVTEDVATAVNTYVASYKTYIENLVAKGFVATELVDVIASCGFTISEKPVQGEASLTLTAKVSAYNYYTQAGQTIDIDMDSIEADLAAANTATTTEVATVDLTTGAHLVAFWNDSDATIKVSKVTLVNGTTTIELPVDGTVSVKDTNGNVVADKIADGVATVEKGKTVVFNVSDVAVEGAYTVKVEYTSDAAATGVLVIDREPGNYVLTDINGNAYTADNGKYTIGNATVTVDNSGAYPQITYVSSKTGVQVFGVLEANASEGTLPDTVTVSTYDVEDDVYVLDYGLNVDLTDKTYNNGLFQNDSLNVNSATEAVTFLGVQAVTSKLSADAYAYTKDGYADAAEGTYGTVSKTGEGTDAVVVYKLNKFLEGIDRYTYAVQAGLKDAAVKNVKTSTPVMEANVTIMPATVVYYEDNFASIITTGAATEGDSSEQGNGLETQYGYDQAYANDSTFSNGGYTALSGTDKFAFTFQGTGFDILTRTADASLKVTVYSADDYDLKYYTHNGKNYITVVKTSENASVLKSVQVSASYENGTLDQVPLVSVDMGGYGNYIVLAQKSGAEALMVDGIRIYNPMGTIADDNKEVTDVYGSENGAAIREVRNMIFGEGYSFSYSNPADPDTAEITAGKNAVAGLVQIQGDKLNITTGSTVVECYTGAVNSEDIAKEPANTSSLFGYAVSGANNELYLTGESYAFGAVISETTADSLLNIGLKSISGTPCVQYKAADNTWKNIKDADALAASIEMYYELDLTDLWKCNNKTVLLVRVIGGTASLTNLKYNGVTFEKITAEALGGVVTEDANTSSFNVLSCGTAGSNTILTFSVDNAVADFTITKAVEGSTTGEWVVTYGTETPIPTGITITKRPGDGVDIYVVKMPKVAGKYTITTATEGSFGTGSFTVE